MLSKMKKEKHEKSKPATDLRGLSLIRDNADAHRCKLVQDLQETETVEQLPNPPYSPDLSPCDFFLFNVLKNNLSRCRYDPQSAIGSAIVQCLQEVTKNINLSAFIAWILRLETEFMSREYTSTGWKE